MYALGHKYFGTPHKEFPVHNRLEVLVMVVLGYQQGKSNQK